jgi:hypothetical protein
MVRYGIIAVHRAPVTGAFLEVSVPLKTDRRISPELTFVHEIVKNIVLTQDTLFAPLGFWNSFRLDERQYHAKYGASVILLRGDRAHSCLTVQAVFRNRR